MRQTLVSLQSFIALNRVHARIGAEADVAERREVTRLVPGLVQVGFGRHGGRDEVATGGSGARGCCERVRRLAERVLGAG